MDKKNDRFLTFCWRATALHVFSYTTAGLIAFSLIDYETFFSSGVLATFMRPVSAPLVALGPCLQIIPGLVLSMMLFPFRSVFLGSKNGWASLLLLIAGFSIFSPQIPGPGTFEGVVYTQASMAEHLLSLPETIIYSLLFSTGLVCWFKFPNRIWNLMSIAAVVLIFAMSILGYLQAIGMLKA